jgi:hypothetical protein
MMNDLTDAGRSSGFKDGSIFLSEAPEGAGHSEERFPWKMQSPSRFARFATPRRGLLRFSRVRIGSSRVGSAPSTWLRRSRAPLSCWPLGDPRLTYWGRPVRSGMRWQTTSAYSFLRPPRFAPRGRVTTSSRGTASVISVG